MEVLILNWKDIKNPDVGGAEIILYELAKRLVNDGIKVTWFCRHFPHAKDQENIDGIDIVRRGNKYTVYWQAFQYYKNLKQKPDKVLDCINTICWQTPLYIPKEKRLAYVNQLAKEVLFYELSRPLAFLSYWFEIWQYLSYKNTKFLCYSVSTKDDVSSFGISKKNIFTFPLGLDHTRYTPGIKSLTPLFVFVARLVKMKRPELCVEAMKIVVNKYPKAQLAIVGYGPLENNLQRQITASRLENNIILVNKDNLFFSKNIKDQKIKLLKKSWAILLPSVKEGWGMVVTEAAACATPAIVSNVTGLKDSVINGKTGVVLPASPTAGELSEAIIKVIKNKNQRIKLSQGALTWSKNFSWENSYKKFKTELLIN